MRIGILTWYFGANYGAKLHSLALQRTLEDLGHKAYFISYRPKEYKSINKRMNINCPHYRRHPLHYMRCCVRCARFEKFNNNYNITKEVYSSSDINALNLDCVILGSDAVFNVSHPLFSEIYFGAGISIPKFSYAPSCENADLQTILSADIKESINSFVGVSVRDRKTETLIKNNIDVKIEQVLDPTFLYDFNGITPDIEHTKYILLYTFSDWSCYKPQIQGFARNNDLRVISVGRFYEWADKSYDAASVYEWLGLIKNASYVFTDSFHGLCFSIKNQKQFVVVSRPDKREKNQDLLDKMGIARGFYEGKESIDEYLKLNIDYEDVNCRLQIMKDKSIKYLKNCLEGVKVV